MALDSKHKRVIYFLKQNNKEVTDIAKRVKMDPEVIWELIRGEVPDNYTPDMLAEFQAELEKVNQAIESRLSRKALATKEKLLNRLDAWINSNKEIDSSSKHRQLVDSINVLKKEVPEVNITSYTWKQGLTMEEALDEYKRLTALAKGSTERKRVSELESGGSAKVSRIDKYADPEGEDPQGPILPTIPETGTIPQE